MPSIEANRQKWSPGSEWNSSGDQWSHTWGGPEKQWRYSLWPRVSRFLPAATILEIAPGYGRWTGFLRQHCKRLIAVDLNQNCVDACKTRYPDIHLHVNDGKSLSMIEDNSIDFIFSFDSLVHAEQDVMDAYISQFPRILTPSGAAFLHHSNVGSYVPAPVAKALLSTPLLRKSRTLQRVTGAKINHHWRAQSVSSQCILKTIGRNGLYCAKQELINWAEDYLNDCLTTITVRPEATIIVENPAFMDEAAAIRAKAGTAS